VFYDPGVGTMTEPTTWQRWKANIKMVLGLATGYGLDDNVLSAYRFLVEHYKPGDNIYLFGFSRGAYTVRVLAGLIHKIGLLSPEQANLAGSGLVAYKQYSGTGRGNDVDDLTDAGGDEDGPLPKDKFDLAAQFARITSSRWPTIHFIGVWDTVASVIVPRADRLYWPSLEELAFTIRNPSVKTFRQAIAIDERRRMFRLKEWAAPQEFWSNRFVPDDKKEPQDILQCGSPACIATSAAAIRKPRARNRISADLDDRGGDESGAELQPAHREPACLGRPAQELTVQLCPARHFWRSGRATQFDDGGLATVGIFFRRARHTRNGRSGRPSSLLHPRLRAARYPRRRACACERGAADGPGPDISAGELADDVCDSANAGAAACAGHGGGGVRWARARDE